MASPWLVRNACARGPSDHRRRIHPLSPGTLAAWVKLSGVGPATRQRARTRRVERSRHQVRSRSRASAPRRSKAFPSSRCSNEWRNRPPGDRPLTLPRSRPQSPQLQPRRSDPDACGWPLQGRGCARHAHRPATGLGRPLSAEPELGPDTGPCLNLARKQRAPKEPMQEPRNFPPSPGHIVKARSGGSVGPERVVVPLAKR